MAFISGMAPVVWQGHADRNQVSDYIELLKSSEEAKRQEGKEKLFHIGSDAIGPLISLLEDLFKDDFTPWFASGRAEEGKEVWERRQRALDSGDAGAARAAWDQLAQLEISGRLKNDVMEILGRLQAQAAVPLLIRIMEEREIDNLWEKMRSEMYALVAIGSPAVPRLIELIKEAKVAAKRNPHGISAYRLQVRAAKVLGLIGDARALPVLKELLRRGKDVIVSQAIEQIKHKIRTRRQTVTESAPQ